MNNKRTEKISFNTFNWIKDALKEIANENEYTVSELIHRIVGRFIVVPNQNRIYIQPEELIRITKRIEAEKIKTPIEIEVEAYDNLEKQRTEKRLRITAIEPHYNEGFYTLGTANGIREEEVQAYINEHPEITTETMLTRNTSEITVMLSSLIEVVNQLKKEQDRYPERAKGVKISIRITDDFTEEDYENNNLKTEKEKKVINFALLECGGLGCIDDFDDIRELTQEEVEKIP